MKIKEIRIAGFRGIPPIDNPPLTISIGNYSNNLRDLLLYGPNAYGKSSIADAIEWFFKEKSRGSTYFREFVEADNAHVHLGQPTKLSVGYIELVVLHNNQEYTLRKSFDATGRKCGESLAGLDTVIDQISDEVIVLDHDQFRNFVAGANAEKWVTFAGLIGFEELDHFRSGLDSLFRRNTLESQLGLSQVKDGIERLNGTIQSKMQAVCTLLDVSWGELDFLKEQILSRSEAICTQLNLPAPASFDALEDGTWGRMRSLLFSTSVIEVRTGQISALTVEAANHEPFGQNTVELLDEFEERVASLAQFKANFDKELLRQFYQNGLTVITQSMTQPDMCPFCEQKIEWSQLRSDVENRSTALRLDDLNQAHKDVQNTWRQIKPAVQGKLNRIQNTRFPGLKEAIQQVQDMTVVDSAITLSSFDETVSTVWVSNCRAFINHLASTHAQIDQELSTLHASPQIDPHDGLRHEIKTCKDAAEIAWSIDTDLQQLHQLQTKKSVIEAIVEAAADTSSRFRNELSDFSSRVAQQINTDVDRYYDALHYDDGVKPSLRVRVAGTQRIVDLQCNYKGIPDRAAVTLLSESHRNSLGLAIFLAFMQFKRRSGTPIEFIVFDDVTQSFDTGHRASLVSLLDNPSFPEIQDYQFLFLTHDRTLADFICRQDEDSNWHRYDIVDWQLHAMRVEPHKDIDHFACARDHLNNGDQLAAAVYGRHGLELLYRTIVQQARLRMQYHSKPWQIKIEDYFNAILDEVRDLWNQPIMQGSQARRRGMIDPARIQIASLSQGIRILHSTVHDSDFLENPPTAGDVANALRAVSAFREIFTCPNCRSKTQPVFTFFHTFARDKQGNPPQCRSKNCKQLLPCDV